MPDFVVYSKEACPACSKAIEMLQLYGKTFRVIKLGADMAFDDFKAAYPGIRVVPFITHKSMEFTSIIRLGTYIRGDK